jgi:K+-sensing histidine kinase KdpD
MPKESPLSGVTYRLAGAGLFVALGTLGALLMQSVGIDAEFQGFVPCIVLACLMFGFIAGTAALIGSAVVLWYYFVPPPGFALPTFGDSTHLVVFLAVGIFLCRIVARQRQTNEELAKENFELGYRNFLLRELRARLRAPRA